MRSCREITTTYRPLYTIDLVRLGQSSKIILPSACFKNDQTKTASATFDAREICILWVCMCMLCLFFQCVIGFYHFFAGHYRIAQAESLFVAAFRCDCSGGGHRYAVGHRCWCGVLVAARFSHMQIRIVSIRTIATETTSTLAKIPANLFAILHVCVRIGFNLLNTKYHLILKNPKLIHNAWLNAKILVRRSNSKCSSFNSDCINFDSFVCISSVHTIFTCFSSDAI